MLTALTHLSAKDIEFLQPHRSRAWAARQVTAIKDAFNSRLVLLVHVARFWGVQEADIINQLRPRFTL